MDQLQDKILNLQLMENKVKEFPSRLLSCLKFNMEFDKDFSTKAAIEKRRQDAKEIRASLEYFLRQSQDTEAIKDEVVRAAEGNRGFFDQLKVQHGITDQEVADWMGEPMVPEDRSDMGSASSVAGEELPDDDEEVSYELRKENLTEISRFSQKNSIE